MPRGEGVTSVGPPQAVVMLAGYFLNERMKAQEARWKGEAENLWEVFPGVRADWIKWATTMAWDIYNKVRDG